MFAANGLNPVNPFVLNPVFLAFHFMALCSPQIVCSECLNGSTNPVSTVLFIHPPASLRARAHIDCSQTSKMKIFAELQFYTILSSSCSC